MSGSSGPAAHGAQVAGPALDQALARAQAHLRGLQSPEGWWKGELQTNVTMDAEDMLLREFLGILHADETERAAARWIRSQQRDDGTWANFSWRTRRPVDDDRGLLGAAAGGRRARTPPHMRSARGVRPAGRAAWSARACSRTSGSRCSACGRGTSCRRCRRSSILLPPWVPLNIYDFACWARQTIVALSIVMAHPPGPPAALRA